MKKKKIIVAVCAVLVIAVIAFAIIMVMINHGKGIDNNPEAPVSGESDVLVAYFSWSGNVQQMARWISEETDGDIFRIVPEEPYSEEYNDCVDRAKDEVDNGIRPAISEHIDKEIMDKYDTIYIGFPIWWYDMPMPVWTFLEEYDLSGKTIIPFFSHNGSSNGGSSLEHLSDITQNADVLKDKAISVRGSKVADSENEIKEWAVEFIKN
ncbi:MAG: flavodoxin [Clostridium sp.]|nr:flavodoxin [Clostridium sp.]